MAIEVFGAGAVQSAYVSYIPLNITLNSITLLWPNSYVNVPYIDPVSGEHFDVLAASMNVTTDVGNLNTIKLPDATMSSVGSNFIITNIGGGGFNVLKSDDTVVVGILPGLSYWIQLTDNSTPQGIWTTVQFGASVSQANANDLAGNGLAALGFPAKLNTNTSVYLTAVPFPIDESYRAKLILWTGGSTTLTLPAIGSVLPGYSVSFNNEGSAQIIIQPGEALTTIDGKPNLAVQVQQSLTIISDGTNWWTLGFGQNQFAVTSSIIINVSVGVDVTLTNIQASSLIQNYEGSLANNITVFFPITTNYWFINNATTNAGILSIQLKDPILGPIGTSYPLPKGTKQIFYSNGLSLFPIPTALNLADPLSLASGGTGAINQSGAANNILPGPTANGDIIYFNAGVWHVLPIGVPGNVLSVSAGLLPEWV